MMDSSLTCWIVWSVRILATGSGLNLRVSAACLPIEDNQTFAAALESALMNEAVLVVSYVIKSVRDDDLTQVLSNESHFSKQPLQQGERRAGADPPGIKGVRSSTQSSRV